MPPKEKKKPPVIIDGVDTTPMTREQLEIFGLRLKEENDREREERNFFQMERDKLRTFWEITRNELEEARAKLRNKDRQIEEEAEKNDAELKYYKQKVKHLQYEHQNDLTECKADSIRTLKQAEDNYTHQERELLKDKRYLKKFVIEQDTAQADQVKALKLEFSEEIHKARTEFEDSSREVELKYDRKFSDLKQELDTKHRMELSEVEERKNKQINDLTDNHEVSYNEMKNYYNDLTLNNLALINSLKEQMEQLRKQNERMTKQVADLTAENRRYVEPLKKAEIEVADYKRRLTNYDKDKLSLANTKLILEKTKRELDDLTWCNEALEQRYEKLQAERDELHKKFVLGILEVQQKTSLKNELLQRRISRLNDDAERREVVIGQLTDKHGEVTVSENKVLQSILVTKNAFIKDLQYELARVCKAHDDLLDTYEELLSQYGIPKQELGFSPLRTIPEGQEGPSRGPAGLAPKKKSSKTKSGGSGNIIDGVDITAMTREQLEGFARRIRDECEREREERNYFQIERDKLKDFWQITQNELEEVRAQLRNKDRQIEEENERNEEEVKLYKQKVKHLQYEHQNNITEGKAEALVTLKLAQDEHIAQEAELLRDRRDLKVQLREKEESYEDLIKDMKLTHSQKISEAIQEFERRARETEDKFRKKMNNLELELSTKHRMEISEIEERKNTQISALTGNHERMLNEMKNYYNDITLNNLALISSLKDQMEVLQKQHDAISKQANNLSVANRSLVQPLRQAEDEVVKLLKQLESYKMDKLALSNIKGKYSALKKEFDRLKWTNEALELRFEKLESEYNELHKKFAKAIINVQQKENLKNAFLLNQIESVSNVAERRKEIIKKLACTEVPVGFYNINKSAQLQNFYFEMGEPPQANTSRASFQKSVTLSEER